MREILNYLASNHIGQQNGNVIKVMNLERYVRKKTFIECTIFTGFMREIPRI